MTWTQIAFEGAPFLVVTLLVFLQIKLDMRGFDRLDARLDAMEHEMNCVRSAREIARHRR